MKFFATKLKINAPAETIWALLSVGASWPTWNPTVDRVEGKIAQGEKITVHAKISPGRAFPVVVSTFTPPQKMVWTGAMPLGLFTGPLAPVFTRSIPDLQPAFEAFAAGLKEHAEAQATA